MGEIRWLEDSPVANWDLPGLDRWTSVRPSGPVLSISEVYSYDPATSPLLRLIGERYAVAATMPITRRRRIRWWWEGLRRRLAAWIDPDERPRGDEW